MEKIKENKSTLVNVLHKLDEIASDLRKCGFVDGDATYDEVLKLRDDASKDFEIYLAISYIE